MLNTHSLKDTDYDNLLSSWWMDWGFVPPMKDFLPDNATGGLMVYDGEVPVAAGFLYETNSRTAWIEWVISNRQYRGSQRRQAISLLLCKLEELAKDKGFSFIFANNNNRFLIKHFENNGFEKGQTNSTELIKVI